MPEPREVIARRLRFQAEACTRLGSPFYASLLYAAIDDVARGGPTWRVLAGFEAESGWAALALRFLAALHRLVLDGGLPALAAHYPSAGGDGDAEAAWRELRGALSVRADEIHALVARPCQTNEVGRSAALFGGFLQVAQDTGMPLRILEIGASAGLNLRWDRYRYEAGASSWGDPGSPVRFDDAFTTPPPMDRAATVAVRRGCDLEPIDPTTAEGSLTLRSFIWADQVARLRRLEGAVAVARTLPVVVERIGAPEFLERELGTPAPGVATVVYHSVVRQYLTQEVRGRVESLIDGARSAAARDAPVTYLHMEPSDNVFEVRLDGRLLAMAGAHGTHVTWLPVNPSPGTGEGWGEGSP